VQALYDGKIIETSPDSKTNMPLLAAALRSGLGDAEERVRRELELASKVGARLLTVMDEDYPANLRLVPNLPPFLFVLGELTTADTRSVAVVGTRQASEAGLARTVRMARLLAERHVTVVSGLAAGIDTAAHIGALDAGGRTLAVLGTGITKCFPKENERLADRIVGAGCALVSQFWPSAPPTRYTFPRRNVVTSGISQGSVVIEASATSGAKMQARLALEHGKRVFLVHSLVTDQPWARKYIDERGAVEVNQVEDILQWLAEPVRVAAVAEARGQLVLAL
jgi:DNA processing protein